MSNIIITELTQIIEAIKITKISEPIKITKTKCVCDKWYCCNCREGENNPCKDCGHES